LTIHSISLRPTDEVGEDGWQFFIVEPDCDVEKIAQSQQLVYEGITQILPSTSWFGRLITSTFLSLLVHQTEFKPIFFRPNIRMVNKFSEGRVFVAGGM
jgi:hypothetical protein